MTNAASLEASAEHVIVERAIAWALEHTGSPDYALRCLAFVEDAYEVANGIEIFGGSSARESAENYDVQSSVGDAPAGAFVFFATSGLVDGIERDWGHVGLATGDGRMIHAWPEVRVDPIGGVSALPSGSWTPPVYVGFAPPSRILVSARLQPFAGRLAADTSPPLTQHQATLSE